MPRLLAYALSAFVLALIPCVWMLSTESASTLGAQKANVNAITWNLRTATWNVAQAASSFDQLAKTMADPKAGVARTLRNINVLTVQLGRTSNVVRLAATDERAQQAGASKLLMANLQSMKALLDDANRNLNGTNGALPEVTADLKALHAALDTANTETATLMQASTAMMNAAGKALGDPNIQVVVKGLADASTESAGAVKDVHSMTTKAEAKFFPPPHKMTFKEKVVFGLKIAPKIVIAWLKAGAPL